MLDLLLRLLTLTLVAAILLLQSAVANANSPLKILYESRPMLSFKNPQGKLVGTLVQSVESTMARAGIHYEWVEMPFNRQLKIIESNQEPTCAAGLFMTPERKKIGKFSRVVLNESDLVLHVLLRREFVLPEGLDLAGVLAIANVSLLIKENISYGKTIDEIITRSPVKKIVTTAELRNMALMIIAKRADLLLTSEAEAQLYIRELEGGNTLRIYRLAGQLIGQERHLLCTKSVPDDLIDRFNRALGH